MSMISVDSHRLVIDEELSRPASRDPWAPPSTLIPRDYESREQASEKVETCEIGIQCQLPIQVPKPASTDAFTQCCNIGKNKY